MLMWMIEIVTTICLTFRTFFVGETKKINVFFTLSRHIYSRKLSSKLTYNFSNYQVAIT